MKFKTLSKAHLKGQRALVRVDFNVPMEKGVVKDESRIVAVLSTLNYLQQQGASIVLMSHLGRPKGKKDEQFSLRPLVKVLQRLLPKAAITFVSDITAKDVEKKSKSLKAGEIMLLENLRFYPEEEENDPKFAKQLARLGDIYVNDAFSACHRAHASIEGIAHFLPSYAGRLLEAELKNLQAFLTTPRPPLVAILGGAKISTKLALIQHLIPKLEALLIGGGMAGTLLEAQGIFIGDSLSEPSLKTEALAIIEKAKKEGCALILSQDVRVARNANTGEGERLTSIHDIQPGEMIMDVGPKTIELFKNTLKRAKTVVWNGPLGRVEVEPFDQGTQSIATFLADQKDMITVSGGGDTVAILNKLDLISKFSYVSMAGGAFLEWLEGRILPGLLALEKQAD